MKKRNFSVVFDSKVTDQTIFQILGGRLPRTPITDPNKDPDADKTADDSQSSSS